MASASTPSSKESISPQPSLKNSLPARVVSQRIRPGILSRQASEREENETASGYLHSASEDDDARYSDTNSLPKRFATTPSQASSIASKAKVTQSPTSHIGLSDPASHHTSAAYSSGGEASSSSSRVHQTLQSRTSLYSRQVSGESYSRGDVSEDGGPAWSSSKNFASGSSSLNRAKSVSSVSSVNSTSSMEAVPFRAAPLGNVRPGYGGYAKGKVPATGQGGERKASEQRLDQMRQGSTANEDVVSKPGAQAGLAKQRILPKGPSDDWLYRNAPGMGARSNARNGMSTFHTIATTREMSRPPLPFGSEDAALNDADGFDEVANDPSTSVTQQVSRAKPSIRSKLAKRAGKLGLKPLTSMATVMSTDGSFVTYTLPNNLGQVPALRASSSDGRGGEVAPLLDAASMPSISLTPSSARLSTELKTNRNSKTYPSNPPIAVFSGDSEPMMRTSSVTHAPLVVQKHPPGPPGSGPPPSPGLIGPPSPFYPFSLASPKVSPNRLSDEVDPITLQTNQMTLGPTHISLEAFELAGSGQRGERSHQRNSFSTPAHTRVGQSDSHEAAEITPAQQIQKDARAGIARAPAEPSGATPGPNPAATSTDSDEEINAADMRQRRPHSLSLSTQQTGRTVTQQSQQPFWSSGNISKATARRLSSGGGSVATAHMRPGILRSMTSDSGLARSSTAKGDDNHPLIKGVSVDESSGVSNYWSGRPTRNGGSSPIDSSSSHSGEAGKDRNSMLRLDIPSEGLAVASPSKRLLNPSPSALTASSELTVQQTPLAWKRNSPDMVTKLLPAIEESRRTDESVLSAAQMGAGDGSDKETLPSTAVSSASASLAPVDIKHPLPDPSDPGHFMPHKEVNATPKVTDVDALGSSKGASSPLLSVSPATQGKPNRGRAASATRSIRVDSDFVFGDILGEGSYSTVMEAWDVKPLRDRNDGQRKEMEDAKVESGAMNAMVGKSLSAKQRASIHGAKAYAVKVLDKVHILKEKKQKYVALEREALSLLIRHPGVITLYWTFQNRDSLYFVLELAPNGELLTAIKKLGSFSVDCARYYGAQLVDTIQGIHDAGVLHRDLKPENVLLDAEMKIKVTDFGSAKVVKSGDTSKSASLEDAATERPRASSFVGTAEYVSPELLNDKQVSEASDWWAFGCLLFQMLCGKPPFKGISEYQTFQKIIKGDFECPEGMSSEASSLIKSILVLDPDKRYKVTEIKAHPFFRLTDWSTVWQTKAPRLEAGIYVRSTPAPSSSSSLNQSARSGESQGAGGDNELGSMSEDDGRSGMSSLSSLPETKSRARPSTAGAFVAVEAELQDADDDDSSLSESRGDGLSPRRRGLSTGASAAEKMQKGFKVNTSSSSSKRASNFFRMTAGLQPAPLDGKFEASAGSSESNSPSRNSMVLRPGSRTGSASNLRQLQGSSSIPGTVPLQQGNRLSMPNSLLANEVARSAVRGDSRQGSMNEQRFHTQPSTSWAALLLPNESLLYSCPILHRTTGALLRSNTKKRQLLLTDFPRLLCVKETNDQLKVKSEVILGLPRIVPTQGRIGYSFQGNDEDDDDDEEDDDEDDGLGGGNGDGEEGERSSARDEGKTALQQQQRRNSHNAPRMQRQRSAGPLNAPPASPRSYGNSASPSTTVSDRMGGVRPDGERRDSYPFGPSKQQQWHAASASSATGHGRSSTPSCRLQQQHLQTRTQPQPQQQQQQQQQQSQATPHHHPLPFVDASPNFMTAIEQRSIRTFLVVTPAKSFLYEDPSGDAAHWVKSICMAAATKARSTTSAGVATYN